MDEIRFSQRVRGAEKRSYESTLRCLVTSSS